MTARPNFLLLITDQHRADHLGCYGNTIVRTPHIDSIAARGTRFGRFHVSSPVCMPNRATLMTGRMPSQHGARCNGVPLSLAATTFVELLRAAGYRTALMGKCHLQSMTGAPSLILREPPGPGEALPPPALSEARHGPYGDGRYDQENGVKWHDDPTFDLDLPYYGFDHVDLTISHADAAHGHYGRWLERQHPGADRLRGPGNALPGSSTIAPQAWRTAIPEELYSTTWTADRTIDYLRDHAAARADAPFFIQCSFADPHHPFTPPGRYWDMYDPADMALPATFGQDDNTLPPTVVHLMRQRAAGVLDTLGQTPYTVSERELRETLALTYGMIAMIDDAIGRILAALAANGLAEDTVVIFTSDHGDFMGDHGLMLKGGIHYQGLLRVPFIWADPARGGRAATADALASTLDIARTVLARAGLAPFHGIQGRSLLPVIDGDSGAGHDDILVEEDGQRANLGWDWPYRVRTLVTARARCTLYHGIGWGELYDLVEDPDEVVNLWDEPAAAGLRAEMLERIARKLMAFADVSPLPTNRA